MGDPDSAGAVLRHLISPKAGRCSPIPYSSSMGSRNKRLDAWLQMFYLGDGQRERHVMCDWSVVLTPANHRPGRG
ncbi:hypothetical protein E2C01_003279 [Portunus trituberculatus]|uniref:Uncharacterized protein n=1 Tax=Portunus trituberculatus TaxID=210409 RepID=A0A5B7CMH7_PORTR|nr:hypothetical protein [Portunus trituberculatus]